MKRHRPTLTLPEIRRAKEVCSGCPVREACFLFAMETDERHGIWGGTTGRERQRIKRKYLGEEPDELAS